MIAFQLSGHDRLAKVQMLHSGKVLITDVCAFLENNSRERATEYLNYVGVTYDQTAIQALIHSAGLCQEVLSSDELDELEREIERKRDAERTKERDQIRQQEKTNLLVSTDKDELERINKLAESIRNLQPNQQAPITISPDCPVAKELRRKLHDLLRG
jgi:histidyl-tRNA synthetase